MSDVQFSNPHRYEYDPDADVVYCRLGFMGLSGYRIGDDGQPWSCRVGRGARAFAGNEWKILKPQKGSGAAKNHLHVTLAWNGGRRQILVHQLVLIAFVGPCPGGMEACHFPDRNARNNSLANLRWGTKKENAEDRDKHGTTARGERSGGSCKAKYTAEQVLTIRAEHATGQTSCIRLAEKYSRILERPVTADGIWRIVARKNWKHI